MNTLERVGFIGFGLIGGSLAKSLKKHHLAKEIIAYDLQHSALVMAKADGVVDTIATALDDTFADCDLIFLCCPVKVNLQMYQALVSIVKPTCIITDVGSTKEDIHAAVEATGASLKFIGGHPMTGSEKSGYEAATAQLFENVFYVLTPSKTSTDQDVALLEALISGIDSIPLIMDAKTHDFTTASISHVPHILAALIVNAVEDLDGDQNYMHTLAAGGFKDITRIASASPVMWQQICLSNKEPILNALSHYKSMLTDVEQMIQDNDSRSLHYLFEDAKLYRASFNDNKKGLLPRQYAFGIDVDDEPGIIAKLATLLSQADVNIKNIGIVNNREIDRGVLNIQFEDQANMDQSILLLRDLGYTVYT